MGGSNIAGALSIYGSLGVPAAGNVPGARDAAVSWTDLNGNLWLFGGASNSYGGPGHNDPWEFNPVINEWTCLVRTKLAFTVRLASPIRRMFRRQIARRWLDRRQRQSVALRR